MAQRGEDINQVTDSGVEYQRPSGDTSNAKHMGLVIDLLQSRKPKSGFFGGVGSLFTQFRE